MDELEGAREHFLKALEHHQHGRLQDAELLYRKAHALAPERESVQTNLAALLVQINRHEEALSLCDAVLSRHPGNVQGLMIAAACRHELNEPEAALALIAQAETQSPSSFDVHITKATMLRSM